MARMFLDEEGLIDEPCLSCENSYIEDIWWEWCCDEKECKCKKRVNTNYSCNNDCENCSFIQRKEI